MVTRNPQHSSLIQMHAFGHPALHQISVHNYSMNPEGIEGHHLEISHDCDERLNPVVASVSLNDSMLQNHSMPIGDHGIKKIIKHDGSQVINSMNISNIAKKQERIRGKQVVFSDEKYWVHHLVDNDLSEEEIEACWWKKKELETIKRVAKELSRGVRRTDGRDGCSSLKMAHKKTRLILNNDFPQLVKLPPTRPDQDLQQWCAHDDGRRGLERFASTDYGSCYLTDVTNNREIVFAEQAKQFQNLTYDPVRIAKASRKVTRRARSFAQFMGEADALVVANARSRVSSKSPSCKRKRKGHRGIVSIPAKAQSPLSLEPLVISESTPNISMKENS